jgi:hypothetical protein
MRPTSWILLLCLLLGAALPACAQNFIDLGAPLAEVSVTADARSTGFEASMTQGLHAGLAVYKLRQPPLGGPDTGFHLDLGLGSEIKGELLEAFHLSGGLSVVSDPARLRDHRVDGLGAFLQADCTLAAHILVGAYVLLPLATGHDFGTLGARIGVRLPPYR